MQVRAQALGSLCPGGPLGPLPGVGLKGVGGLKCRKIRCFRHMTLKNTCLLTLWPLLGGAWERRFSLYLRYYPPLWHVLEEAWKSDIMHIYVILALFARPLHDLGHGWKIAPRRPPEAHFKHFWAQATKWLPGGLQRLILSISGLLLQSGSHEAERPLCELQSRRASPKVR